MVRGNTQRSLPVRAVEHDLYVAPDLAHRLRRQGMSSALTMAAQALRAVGESDLAA